MINLSLTHWITQRVFLHRSRSRIFTTCLAVLLSAASAGSSMAAASSRDPLGTTPTPTPTPAGPPLVYNDGDLFLGFRATDSTKDYLVNIGQPSQFVNASPGSSFAVSTGSLLNDLSATFGSDWCTRIDPDTGVKALLVAVVGGRVIPGAGDDAYTLYSTSLSTSGWPSQPNGAQSFTSSFISGMGTTFAGNNPTANNPNGLVQNINSSNSYRSFQPEGVNSGGISFQTWNPTNEGDLAATLTFTRIPPSSGARVLGTFTLGCFGTLTFTANNQPTPTPTPPTVAIAGTVSYCTSSPAPNPVPGVTITVTGSMSTSTLSNGSGAYNVSSLPSGGSFVVTPAKNPRTAGSAGITTTDVIATQRHFLNITLLTGCKLSSADVNGDTNITTVDVIAIQRFFLGLSTGTANAGKYSFSPSNRSYSGITSNQTAQNYDTIIFGDIAAPYADRAQGPAPDAADDSGIELAPSVADLALPETALDQSGTFAVAVTTSLIDPRSQIVGFQGDLIFDSRVISFDGMPVEKAGLTTGNWNVSANVLPGWGAFRTLRISAFSNDFVPLAGAGTLFELRMSKSSKSAASTQLIWAEAPNNFIFIDAGLNWQSPANATVGTIVTSTKQK